MAADHPGSPGEWSHFKNSSTDTPPFIIIRRAVYVIKVPVDSILPIIHV